MIKIINIIFLFVILIYSLGFSEERGDIKYIKEYIRNIENLKPSKISYITNIAFRCYYYYNARIKLLEKDIINSAEEGKENRFPLIPSNVFSYCPKVIVSVSSSPLEPEGIFRKGVIYISYNPSKMCKTEKFFGVFRDKVCQKPDFDVALMHELTHFAFYRIYGNIKFRRVLFKKYNECKKTNCPEMETLKQIVAYRNFYDEFPAILFSNIWVKLQKCNFTDARNLPNFKFFVKTTLFLSKREFLNCRLKGNCSVYFLYRQLTNVADSFNICVPKREAFKILVKTAIEDEKKNFLPLVKKYLNNISVR